MEQIKLDLIPGKVMPVCHASQFDVGRVIRVNLTEGGAEYMLSTETAVVNVRKGDNNIVTRGVTVTSGKSYLDIVTTEQMCAIAGNNLCEIKLTKGAKLIGTLNFILEVEADPTNGGVESHSEIHNLQQQCDEWVAEAMSNYSAIIPTEHAGPASIATFSTSLALPLVECKAEIVAQQASGTPTPSNPLPITGASEVNVTHTGKNLLAKPFIYNDNDNLDSLSECFFIKKGSYIASFGSITNATSWRFIIRLKDANGNNLNTSDYVTFNTGFQWSTTRKAWLNSANTIAYSCIFTLNQDCYIRILFGVGNTSSSSVASNAQLEQGSTATAYEPYNAETKTIALGQTIYGGSVDCIGGSGSKAFDIADFSNLVKNSASATDWIYYSRQSNFNVGRRLDTLCSHFPRGGLSTPATWTNNNTIIYFNLDGVIGTNDVTTAKAYLANIQFVYPLATPTEITGLTPANFTTFAGENNIFSDSGDIELTYNISIDEAIQRAIANLGAIGVPYNNSQSGLTATNVQGAIDELAGT